MANKRTTKKRTAPAAKSEEALKTASVEEVKAAEIVAEDNEIVEEQKTEQTIENTVEEVMDEEAVPAAEAAEQEGPKRRGRKPGAKNKPKEVKAAKETKAAAENKNNVFVEFAGKQYKTEDVIASIQAAWVAEGHRVGSIKSLNVYIKPEECRAYYVINEKNIGSVSL